MNVKCEFWSGLQVLLVVVLCYQADGQHYCPRERRVQITFVQDRTFTFQGFIRQFAEASSRIVAAVKRDFPNAEFGYTAFADYDVKLKKHFPHRDPHPVDSWTSCYEFIQGFTNDEDYFRDTVMGFSRVPPVNGAYDSPEASMTGILYAVSDKRLAWDNSDNPNVKKIIILITDEDTIGENTAPKLQRKPRPRGDGNDNCIDFNFPETFWVGDVMYAKNFSIIGLLAPNTRSPPINIKKTWENHFWTLGVPHHIEMMQDPNSAVSNIANIIANSVRKLACMDQPQPPQQAYPPPSQYSNQPPPTHDQGPPPKQAPAVQNIFLTQQTNIFILPSDSPNYKHRERSRPPPPRLSEDESPPEENQKGGVDKVQVVFLLDRTQKFQYFNQNFAQKAKNFVIIMKKLFKNVEFGITAFADFPMYLKKGGKKHQGGGGGGGSGLDIEDEDRCYERILPLTPNGKRFLFKLREFAETEWVNSYDPPDSSMTGLLYTAGDTELKWDTSGKPNVHKLIVMTTNENTVSKKDAPNLAKFDKPRGDGTDTCTEHSFPDISTVKKVLQKGKFELLGLIAPNNDRKKGWPKINPVTLWNKYFAQLSVDHHIEKLNSTRGQEQIVKKMIRGVKVTVLDEPMEEEEEEEEQPKHENEKGHEEEECTDEEEENNKNRKKMKGRRVAEDSDEEEDPDENPTKRPGGREQQKGKQAQKKTLQKKPGKGHQQEEEDEDNNDDDKENADATFIFGGKAPPKTQKQRVTVKGKQKKKTDDVEDEEESSPQPGKPGKKPQDAENKKKKEKRCKSKRKKGAKDNDESIEVEIEIEVPVISKLQMAFVIERGKAYRTFLTGFAEGLVQLIENIRKQFTLVEVGLVAFDDYDEAIKKGKPSKNKNKDISCYELIQPLTQSDYTIRMKLEDFTNSNWTNVDSDPPASSLTAITYAATDPKMKWNTEGDPNTKKLIVLITNEEPVDELDAPGLTDKPKPKGDGHDTCTEHSFPDPETAATTLSEGNFGVIALIGPNKRKPTKKKAWPKWPPIDSWARWEEILSGMGIEYLMSPIPIDNELEDEPTVRSEEEGFAVDNTDNDSESPKKLHFEYVEWFEDLTCQSIDAMTQSSPSGDTETTDTSGAVECAAAAKLQLVFVQDKSASFSIFIKEMALMAKTIMEGVQKEFPEVEFGLTAFSDFDQELKNGTELDVKVNPKTSCYEKILPLTSDVKEFTKKLGEFSKLPEVDGGGGGQSAMTGLFYTATDPKMKWDTSGKADVKRVLVLVTNEDTVSEKDAPNLIGKPKPKGDGKDTCHKHSFPEIETVGKTLQKKGFDVIGMLPQNRKAKEKIDIVSTWDSYFSRLGINYHIDALEVAHIPGGVTTRLIGGLKVVSCQDAEIDMIE